MFNFAPWPGRPDERRAHTEHTQSTHRAHTEHTQSTHRAHTERTQSAHRAHTEHTQSTHRAHTERTHTRTHMRIHMRNNMKVTIVTFGTFRSVLPLQVPESALALRGCLIEGSLQGEK